MVPDRERVNRELEWTADLNPGPWKEHSLCMAAACESIVFRRSHMGRDRAYVLDLLHDTGRYAGRTSERHLLDEHRRYVEHRWEEATRICMSHVFVIQDIGTFIGKFDVTPQDCELMKELISGVVYDDYDRLVRLRDSLTLPTGFCLLETRFVDATIRYEAHPSAIPRQRRVLEIKDYFEEQMGCTIYEVLPRRGRLQRLQGNTGDIRISPLLQSL